jgi:hypothetical protein
MNIPVDVFRDTLLELLSEAYTGPNHAHTWFIGNEPGSGLFGTLEGLSAEDASRVQSHGSTVAAHTEHLRWSLAHANAFARGETPAEGWDESWSLRVVDAAAWDELRAALRREFDTLLEAIKQQQDFSDPQMPTGIMALVPHAAYHLGAIRQMVARPEDA